MSIFLDPIIITLSDTDPLVSLQTYDPKHGWSQRFYLTKEALISQLADDPACSVTETDLLNVCTVAHVGNSIRFTLFWLNSNYNDDICGYRQTVFLPVDEVSKAVAGGRIKHLSYSHVQQPKASIFFTQTAHRAIAEADKLKRHAICKFLRDNFNYGRSEHLVVQEDSWVHGFYFFSTVSHYEGGIVPHETVVKGKDGKPHRKVCFGLHT